MLAIRLQRTGRRNLPTYRLVVAEHKKAVKGGFIEILGHFLPGREPNVFEVNADRITYWTGKGAIPSDTVARLLKRQGMKNMDSYIKRYTKQRPKNAPEEEAAPAAPQASAEPAAAPAEEAPAEQKADDTAA